MSFRPLDQPLIVVLILLLALLLATLTLLGMWIHAHVFSYVLSGYLG